jgi:hypothetical protein
MDANETEKLRKRVADLESLLSNPFKAPVLDYSNEIAGYKCAWCGEPEEGRYKYVIPYVPETHWKGCECRICTLKKENPDRLREEVFVKEHAKECQWQKVMGENAK